MHPTRQIPNRWQEQLGGVYGVEAFLVAAEFAADFDVGAFAEDAGDFFLA